MFHLFGPAAGRELALKSVNVEPRTNVKTKKEAEEKEEGRDAEPSKRRKTEHV